MQAKLLFSILNYKVCTCLYFSYFFPIFCRFLEALGFLLAALWSLCRLCWRAGFILLGAFGSPGLSVDPHCYFLCCLWLVWVVCGLGDRSGIVFCFIFDSFWCHLLGNSGWILKFFDVRFERCCVRFLFLVRLFGYFS